MGRLVSLKRHWLEMALLVVPLLTAALYFGVIAQDRFVSESRFVVKRAGDLGGASSALGGLLAGVAGSGAEDTLLLRQYIHSPDVLSKLDAQLNLRNAFGKAGADLLYRLPADATREQFLEYYRARVEVGFDELSHTLTLRTQGFTPEFAQAFNRALLAESEAFINELSHRITRDEMAFAQRELDQTYARLTAAREALLTYQNTHGMLDPVARAEAASRMVAEMEARLALQEAELRNLQTYLNDDSPQVVAARNALGALRAQIVAEKTKLASPREDRLNRKAAQFIELRAKVDFQTDLYKLTLTALEKTRVETARKLKTLAVISVPALPEEAEYPRKLYQLLSLLLGCLLFYGVVRLTISIIEDHRT